ncbi:MAG: heptosyltransferase [Ignavibacteria bacterium]|nr:MAG: heptosyltransferase [Ignavibacteria bacterium]
MDAQDLEILMKKILVIQTAFLGDAILTLPLIQKLKEANPDSEITALCIPSTQDARCF